MIGNATASGAVAVGMDDHWDSFIADVQRGAACHYEHFGDDYKWLTRGRELVSAAGQGRPDVVGFVASLRQELDGAPRNWGGEIRTPTSEEAMTLRHLAAHIERVAEKLGFI